MKSESSNFGKRLKAIRREKGLTQEALAKMLSTTPRMIAHYEKEGNKPRIDKVKAFADALEVSVEELVDDAKKPASKKQESVTYSLMKRMKIVEQLPLRDQKAIFRLINSLAEKQGIK